jgi:uncharacterized protein (TIGR03437 family)
MLSWMRSAWLLLAAAAAYGQVTVATYHNDNFRTGLNASEPLLSPVTVQPGKFGRRFAYTLDGNAYTQPLYLPSVPIAGKGVHNVVIVATGHNSVYAFDADIPGDPLWQISFLDAAAGITAVPFKDVGCAVIAPEIGVTGTPVADPATLTLYVIAETKEPGPTYVYRLHALDVTTGSERPGSPVKIEPDGFVPFAQKHRAGLLLANGRVYSTWSGICDRGEYQGWIMAHDPQTLELLKAFADSPTKKGGSFWNGGAGPAADAAGNLYTATANGPFTADEGGVDYGDSFLKLSPDLAVTDYFAPYNREDLDAADVDLGSSSPVLLPDAAGSAEHPHLMAGGGKEGRIYLLDRDQMGQAQNGSDADALASLPYFSHSLFGSAAYFNRTLYFAPEYSPMAAFQVANASLSLLPSSQATTNTDALGATPSVSASGNTNGVVWISPFVGGGSLEAYDATDVSKRLFTSTADPANGLGGWSEFTVPTIADGKVFVSAGNQLVVYGVLNSTAGTTGALTNAASYAANGVAPGSLVSIFGTNLALATAGAVSQPLPISLADASVRVNGVVAPLLYVSDGQINFQIPAETQAGTATVLVTVCGKASMPFPFQVLPVAPGIFMRLNGDAAAQIGGSPVSSSNPAPAGSVVSVYLTGFGTGSPVVTATIGGANAPVQFAGAAPGFVGLSQVNVMVPPLSSGAYPLVITAAGVPSNAAQLSVGTL